MKPEIDQTAIIHETARLVGHVRVGAHAKIGPNCRLNGLAGEITVGRWTHLTDGTTIYGYTEIGAFCLFAEGVYIIECNHNLTKPSINSYFYRNCLGLRAGLKSKGPIKIGCDVWLAKGVTVLGGVTIGNGCVVGAESVVTKNLEAYGVYAGSPAVFKRWRFNEKTREMLKTLNWYSWPDTKLKAHKEFFGRHLE